jgi:adenine-specific DNA-methyltransferase
MVQIDFKGKQFIRNHHLAVKYHQLVPDEKKSLTDKISLHDNLIIHGDNLKALKALLPTYAGRIKCIYIDPPYNTGNEGWVYNDNVNSPMMQEWLGRVVDKEDLTRHDKWLCMMWPRLRLLRELMTEDGIIFISIDDNAQAGLRLLCDEIFGEDKFLAQFVWKSRQNKDNRNITGASIDHEYVLCYGKSIRGEDRNIEQFSNPDNDLRGPWASGNMVGLASEEHRPNLHYDLINSETGINYGKPKQGWRYDKTRMQRLIEEKRILWPESPNGRPRVKVFLSEMKQEFTGFSSIIGDGVYTRDGTKEIETIFNARALDFPKSSILISGLIKQGAAKDSIILDSFAGSGTTAHAVLALNKEDGGNRKFILVEMEDYADKITAERVRRVIKGVKGTKDEHLKKGLGGTFSYFTLGDPIEMESVLSGENLPSYQELARYLFFTATGEKLEVSDIDEEKFYVGESKNYHVYLFYRPDVAFLKATALTLEHAKALHTPLEKRRLVFAPTRYLDQEFLDTYRIDFAQLPFEIHKMAR